MNPLKSAIFGEVKKNHVESVNLTEEQLDHLIFLSPDSLRLTLRGFLVLKKIFTAYSFEVPYTLKAKHQIGMSRMEYPYYVTTRRFILFSEMDAMMVKLHGGIEGFLETCFNLEQ
jgi:hypothetical protein